jgi:hypothetical protein
MPHSTPRRGGLSRDEPDHRLLEVRLDPVGRILFGIPADLTDQHHGFGRRILGEELQRVDEAGADERVAADPDTRRLAQAVTGQLVNRLVGQGAALGDDTDASFLADVAGDDSGFGLARGNQSRTVRADYASPAAADRGKHPHHVENGNSFGNADSKREFRVPRLQDCVRCTRGRHEDHRRVGAGRLDALRDRVEHGPSFVRRPSLTRRDAANHGRAIGRRLFGVEGAFASGETLDEQSRVLVD